MYACKGSPIDVIKYLQKIDPYNLRFDDFNGYNTLWYVLFNKKNKNINYELITFLLSGRSKIEDKQGHPRKYTLLMLAVFFCEELAIIHFLLDTHQANITATYDMITSLLLLN